MRDIANTFETMGCLGDELKWKRKICDILNEWKGEYHEDTLKETQLLADTYDKLSQKNKALEIRKQIIDKYQKKINNLIKINGENNDEVIFNMERLASSLNEIEYYEEELVWLQKIADILKNWKGEDDIATILAISNAEYHKESRKALDRISELSDKSKD